MRGEGEGRKRVSMESSWKCSLTLFALNAFAIAQDEQRSDHYKKKKFTVVSHEIFLGGFRSGFGEEPLFYISF